MTGIKRTAKYRLALSNLHSQTWSIAYVLDEALEFDCSGEPQYAESYRRAVDAYKDSLKAETDSILEELKHGRTAGSWYTVKDPNGDVTIQANATNVATVHYINRGDGTSEFESNVRLLAKAPELVDALQAILHGRDPKDFAGLVAEVGGK